MTAAYREARVSNTNPYLEQMQRQLDLRVEVRRAPLVCINTAKAILGVTEDDVLAAIEEASIRWAFDLRFPGASKAFVRIYSKSLAEKVAGIRNNDGPEKIEAVLEEIFPASRQLWPAALIARKWNCGQDHTSELVHCGALERFIKEYKVNESPLVYRTSLLSFMKQRVMVP